MDEKKEINLFEDEFHDIYCGHFKNPDAKFQLN